MHRQNLKTFLVAGFCTTIKLQWRRTLVHQLNIKHFLKCNLHYLAGVSFIELFLIYLDLKDQVI